MSKWNLQAPSEEEDVFATRRSSNHPPPPHWRSPSNSSHGGGAATHGHAPTPYYVQSPAQEEDPAAFGLLGVRIPIGGGNKAMYSAAPSTGGILMSSSSVESSPMPSPLASPYRGTRPPKAMANDRMSTSTTTADYGRRTGNSIRMQHHGHPPIHEGDVDGGQQQQQEQRLLRPSSSDKLMESRRTAVRNILLLTFFLFCFLGFIFLVMWLALRPSKPQISVKDASFQILNVLSGVDNSGVTTTMVTFNSTIKVDIINRSKYLQVRAQPFEIAIYLSELLIATNQVDDYVQPKDSKRLVPVNIHAENVPLYGASNELPTTNDASTKGYNVPLTLVTSIRAHYLIVGHMITSNHWTRVTCNITVNTKTLSLLTPVASSCSIL